VKVGLVESGSGKQWLPATATASLKVGLGESMSSGVIYLGGNRGTQYYLAILNRL